MTDRLGWIRAPRESLETWPALAAFGAEVAREGVRRVLLCGMGGSSLAPTVLAHSFGEAALPLQVLDSTDPAAVRAAERLHAPDDTLYIISSKSGTTAETLAFYRYFAARAPAERFVAISDPGSPLDSLARARGFRAVFAHPADVGGRYAALTVVGMLPAALLGVDGPALLERALAVDVERARALGAGLADAARRGRDKLVLRPPPRIARLADWVEQLVAESASKDGRGLVPIVDAPAGERAPDALEVADFSPEPLDLGAEFLRWEHATAELCAILGVDAFDQPDVEAAKAFARAELERPSGGPAAALPTTLSLQALTAAARPGDYVAVLAYLAPTADTAARLAKVRTAWARRLGIATTVGFGPRYLHSTGQLHKGGPNTGLFLVLTADDAEDVEIPETGRTFGQLKRAQAVGDVRALLARGRRVAHVHLRRADEVSTLA